MKNVKQSILLSIFKRKGGEGKYTKVLPSNLTLNDQADKLVNAKKEVILISYYKNTDEWFILTSNHAAWKYGDESNSLSFNNITSVRMPLADTVIPENMNMNQLVTLRMIIGSSEGHKFTVRIESGRPYNGLFQVLSFLSSKT